MTDYSFKQSKQAHLKGFTLIELLVVIAIIIALAGIVFASFTIANRTSNRKKAEVDAQVLQTALGEYKIDNGAYPANAGTDAAEAALGAGVLYQALSGNGDDLLGGSVASVDDPSADDLGTVYLDSLLPGSEGLQRWVEEVDDQLSVVDPWGNPWNYVSGDVENQNNIEYDLWSRGPENSSAETQWITNWK